MRLNKYISHAGAASRRRADELTLAGKVRINGKVMSEPGYDVAEGDIVEVDGKVVEPVSDLIYILLNKPRGYVTTTSDDRGRHTVMELITDIPERIYPVGRLDYNTTGLLIMEKTTPRRCRKTICALVILLLAAVCIGYISYEESKGLTGTETHITAAVAQMMAGDQTKVAAGSQQYVGDKISEALSLSEINTKAVGVLRANEAVAADAKVLERDASENVFALSNADVKSSPLEKEDGTAISVIIDIDGSRLEVKTKARTVEGVLEDAGVAAESSDTVSPSLTSGVHDGDVIKVTRAVTIHINVDGGSITAHAGRPL